MQIQLYWAELAKPLRAGASLYRTSVLKRAVGLSVALLPVCFITNSIDITTPNPAIPGTCWMCRCLVTDQADTYTRLNALNPGQLRPKRRLS